ncbi:hypothetical protein E8E13_001344 [Curvularia kusanoi]|uniref:Heterokaryon incompatibility domain-containing protein n=1 Tax=Curvularia kusanoi TaxID=90978 RepID=A0A9P4W818_CURKU|nr:hypothetical protein E8E13_001344 [Curvularia kusanoi]
MLYESRLEGRKIRLIRLELDTYRAPIRCKLIEASLDDSPAYETLSYVWGDAKVTEPIFCNGVILHVTINLARALRRIRLGISPPENKAEQRDDEGHKSEAQPDHIQEASKTASYSDPKARPYRPDLLWADAICINQADLSERGDQVQLMREIYSNAMRVIIWLGDSYFSAKKMAFCKMVVESTASMLNTEDQKLLVQNLTPDDMEKNNSKFGRMRESGSISILEVALSDLGLAISVGFSSEWFIRLWCEQEAVLSCEKLLLYRNSEIRCESVYTFVVWIMIRTMLAPDLSLRLGVSPRVMINLGQCIARLRPLSQFRQESASVSLMLARRCAVTDPRDKFYASIGALGLDSVNVDYTKSINEVYTDCALHTLDQGLKILTLVMHPGDFDHRSGLPSWVPDLKMPDPVVPMDVLRGLADDAPASSRDISKPGAQQGVLSLAGIWCDIIGPCSEILHVAPGDPGRMMRILREIFVSLDALIETSDPKFKLSVARTFTGGCSEAWIGSSPSNNKDQFIRNFMAYRRFILDKIDTSDHMNRHSFLNEIISYGNLISRSIPHRRFFRTQKSWFGFGPECMRDGDIVVVFHGGTSPFVLRPIESRPDHYHLMGECYVDLLRDEGAYRMLGKGGVEERVFYLV